MMIMTIMTFRRGDDDVEGWWGGVVTMVTFWVVDGRVAGRLLCLVSLFFWGWGGGGREVREGEGGGRRRWGWGWEVVVKEGGRYSSEAVREL